MSQALTKGPWCAIFKSTQVSSKLNIRSQISTNTPSKMILLRFVISSCSILMGFWSNMIQNRRISTLLLGWNWLWVRYFFMNRTFNSFGFDIFWDSELMFVWVRIFLRNRTSPALARLLVTNPNPHEPTREVYSLRWGMQSKYIKERASGIYLFNVFLLLEPYLHHRAGPVFPFIRIFEISQQIFRFYRIACTVKD